MPPMKRTDLLALLLALRHLILRGALLLLIGLLFLWKHAVLVRGLLVKLMLLRRTPRSSLQLAVLHLIQRKALLLVMGLLSRVTTPRLNNLPGRKLTELRRLLLELLVLRRMQGSSHMQRVSI